jgi:hypothetical protein
VLKRDVRNVDALGLDALVAGIGDVESHAID